MPLKLQMVANVGLEADRRVTSGFDLDNFHRNFVRFDLNFLLYLLRLDVYCKHKRFGCFVQCSWDSLEKHEKECKFSDRVCKNCHLVYKDSDVSMKSLVLVAWT